MNNKIIYTAKKLQDRLAINSCAAKSPLLVASNSEKARINRSLQQHRLHVYCRVSAINRGRHSSRINNKENSLNVIYCNSSHTKCVVHLIVIGKETTHEMYYHLDDALTS